MKKISLILIGIFITGLSYSQSVYDMNNVYKKNHHIEKDVIKQPHLREADVMWSNKIWRKIDLRQKINHPFYYPQDRGTQTTVDRDNLFKCLYNAALGEGNWVADGSQPIRVFDATNSDEFIKELGAEELRTLIEGKFGDPVPIPDSYGNDSLDINGNVVYTEGEREGGIDLSDIKTWIVKEQWFFDKQRSVMDVRIIGICPVADAREREGPNAGQLTGGPGKKICWFYFPEISDVLNNAQVFNLFNNEAENRTFLDIFRKRQFSSTIIKRGNAYDRKISDYMIGLDALLEAERIKADIFNLEHDLWEY
tara:strand:- start:1329 stop:2255 length:927 start_codon:yes stop_codon:yes gene_type:complete